MPTLTVKLQNGIKFENGGPVFTRWLPTSNSNKIKINKGNLELTLWFEEKDFFLGAPAPKKEKKTHINMDARCIYAEVKVKKITKKLASYIENYDPKKLHDKENKSAEDFKKLGEEIYLLILSKVNRLIDYTRTEKAQYWLDEKEIDTGNMESFYVECSAIHKVNDGAWKRFRPTDNSMLTVYMPSEETLIKKNEWPKFTSFIQGDARSNLVKSLLVSADKLESKGHRRSALTESVTALEVALSEFSEHPRENIYPKKIIERLNIKTLKAYVKRIGFTGSFNYLLPLLFTESRLSLEVIQTCRKAIEMRNNVVHEGQRDVHEKQLRKFLINIRKCCETLALFTAPAIDPKGKY